MSPRAVIRGGVLTFTAVDLADEGEYTCKALNTHGEHTARGSLFIQSMPCVYVCVDIYYSYVLWGHRTVYTVILYCTEHNLPLANEIVKFISNITHPS